MSNDVDLHHWCGCMRHTVTFVRIWHYMQVVLSCHWMILAIFQHQYQNLLRPKLRPRSVLQDQGQGQNLQDQELKSKTRSCNTCSLSDNILSDFYLQLRITAQARAAIVFLQIHATVTVLITVLVLVFVCQDVFLGKTSESVQLQNFAHGRDSWRTKKGR